MPERANRLDPEDSASAEPDRLSKPTSTQPRRSRAWVWLALGLFSLIGFLSIGLTPVTLTVTGGVPTGSVENGTWEEVPKPVPSKIVVRSRGKGTAALGVPVLRWPEIFGEDLISSSRGFRADPASGGFTTHKSGRIVFRGVIGSFSIALLPSSTVGSVTMVRSGPGTTRKVTAVPGENVTLASPTASFQRTTSFLWRSVPARLARPAQANLEASVGGFQIKASGKNALSFSSVAPRAILLFLRAVLIFVAASLLVIFGWLVARSLDPIENESRRWIALQAAAGLALLAVVANSLAYFMPTTLVAWIVLSVGLVLVAVGRLRRRGTRNYKPALTQLLKLIALALIPAALLFLPVLHWGLWYAGQYNTDLFQYAHLSSLLREHSLLAMRGIPEAINSGLIASGAGFEWKSIDSVLASMVSVVTFSSSIAGLVLISISLFLLFSIGLFALLPEIQSRSASLMTVLLLLASPALVLLFVENYQSQYYLVAFVPGLVLAFTEGFRKAPSEPVASAWYRYLLVGALAASSLLVYPYFAVFILAGLALTALILNRPFVSALKALAAASAVALALLNIGALTFLYLPASMKWQEGLDAIASNVLIQPYSIPQLGFLAAGITPYSWRWPYIDPSPAMGWFGGHVWSMGPSAWDPGPLGIAAVAILIGGFMFALDWKLNLRNAPFVASCVALAIFVGLSIFFIIDGSSYSALKVGWTAVAIGPLAIVSAIYRPRFTWLLLLALVPIGALWIRTDLLDRANWMIGRQSLAASLSHSSSQPELARIRQELRDSPGSVAIIRGAQPIAGSDRDNVVYNHTRVFVREFRRDCESCASNNTLAASLPRTIECGSAARLVIRIGLSGKDVVCGRKLVFSGPTVELYRLSP